MRYIRDTACLLLLLAVVTGYYFFQKQQSYEQRDVTNAAENLRRMQSEVKLRAAARLCELNARGWPLTIDPAWFGKGAPRNTLLDANRPWVEVARPEEAHLQHPPVRIAIDHRLAGLWYNPYQGVVRARVPVTLSDARATELYNQINDTSISSIFFVEHVPTQDADVKAAHKDQAQTQASDKANSGSELDPTLDPTLDPRLPRPEPKQTTEAPTGQ